MLHQCCSQLQTLSPPGVKRASLAALLSCEGIVYVGWRGTRCAIVPLQIAQDLQRDFVDRSFTGLPMHYYVLLVSSSQLHALMLHGRSAALMLNSCETH